MITSYLNSSSRRTGKERKADLSISAYAGSASCKTVCNSIVKSPLQQVLQVAKLVIRISLRSNTRI